MSSGCGFDLFCYFLGCLLRFFKSSSPMSLFIFLNFPIMLIF